MWWLTFPVIIYSTGLLVLWVFIVRRGRDEHRAAVSLPEVSVVVAAGDENKAPEPVALPKVSVVVAARNEEKSITGLLESLALQDYPQELLEVIIVNDNSTDRTPIVVSEFISSRKGQPGARIRLIYNPFSGKKRAMRYGIEKSGGEIILTTDADCIAGPGWVRSHATCYGRARSESVSSPAMADCGGDRSNIFADTAVSGEVEDGGIDRSNIFADTAVYGEAASDQTQSLHSRDRENLPAMVLAPVYQKPGKGFWSHFGVYEFSALQAITEATAVAGHAVMCNAANMSFRRESYLRHADELRPDLPSGDDMFLLQAVMRDGGTVMHHGRSAAAVETAAAVSAAALLRQRARWASKAFHYRDTPTLTIAAATAACNAAVTAAAVMACFSVEYVPAVAAMYGIKIIPDYLMIAGEMKKRGGRVQMISFIASEFVYPFYFIVLGVMSLFPSARRFRGR